MSYGPGAAEPTGFEPATDTNLPPEPEVFVPTERDRDYLRLRMISLAQERGLSWAQIAKSLGAPNGKTLKNDTKALARRLERQLRAEAQNVEV